MTDTRENLLDIILQGRDIADQKCGEQESCENCQYQAPKGCAWGIIADHLIANGVTIQSELLTNCQQSVGDKWVSTAERLPQEDLPIGALCEVVQVLLNDGSVTIGWCNRGLRCWFHMPIRETKMVGHDYEHTPVVAWQPLAQPAKEAE